MKIYFCDGCNESIPLADIQAGQATTIKGKLFCRNCIPPGAGGPSQAAPVARRGAHPLLVVVIVLLVGYTIWRDLPGLRTVVGGPTGVPGQTARSADSQAVQGLTADLAALRGELDEMDRRQTFQRSDLDALRALAADIGRGLDQLREAIDGLQRSQAETGQLIEKLHIQENTTQSLQARIDTLADMVAATQNRMTAAEAAAAVAATEPEPAASPADTTAAAEKEQLRRQLKDADAGRRFDAVDRIGKARMKDLAPDLIPMLKDEDLFVRSLAMQVIGDFGQVEAVPALLDVLEDPSATIRKYAAEALVRLTGFDPQYDPAASKAEREKAVRRWRDWIAGKPQ